MPAVGIEGKTVVLVDDVLYPAAPYAPPSTRSTPTDDPLWYA